MKKMSKIIQSKDKGQVIVLVAISLIVIFALAALAIDVGIAYNIKAKLNSAVDGAALAAGRAVKQGYSDSEREINAKNAAKKFFSANYPSGYMSSTLLSPEPTTTVVHNGNGSWTISVTNSATPPLYFARAVGWNAMNVNALAETTVRDLDMILVLDTSGSMDKSDPDDPRHRRAIDLLAPAAWNFINRFEAANGGDRIGVITFASGAVANLEIDKTDTRGFDKQAIRNLLCKSPNFDVDCVNNLPASGSTASGEAMRRALTDLNLVPSSKRSSLRIIVFFSDGAPNDVSGSFNSNSARIIGDLYSEADQDYSYVSETAKAHQVYNISHRDQKKGDYSIETLPASMDYSTIPGLPYVNETQTVNLASNTSVRTLPNYGNTQCNVNRAARNMVENVANTARSGTGLNGVTIHTLGLGQRLKTLEASRCTGYDTREWGENILKRIANTSDASPRNPNQPTGLYVYAQSASGLDNAFQTIANQILRLTK